MITAPFNFVPLSKKVFFPPWAEWVSHDIPFSDGECGTITVKLTAKAPLFIKDKEKPKEFCQFKGNYFIPGSSLKGMVRNVLEIMSFSKMSFVDDTTYSLRDIKSSSYMKNVKGAYCGWLYKREDGSYQIRDCGIPYRVSYDEIERQFDDNFKKELFLVKETYLVKKDNKWFRKQLTKESKAEYDLLLEEKKESIALQDFFNTGTFDNADSKYKVAKEKYNLLDATSSNVFRFNHIGDSEGRKVVVFDESGDIQGRLVLTGHPSPRYENRDEAQEYDIDASGKIYDFVFEEKENTVPLDVSEEVMQSFKFAYFDGRKKQPVESADWTYWKAILENSEEGEVPVFFHKEGDKVSSFGLSYLYKFPYTYSICDALYDEHKKADIDLTQAMFGYASQNNSSASIKGRVQFSNALLNKDTLKKWKPETYNVLLASPKASYYPIYLEQGQKDPVTLMKPQAKLSGWKRYPVHKKTTLKSVDKSSQTTAMTPLPEGTTFDFKIRVHNLRTVELGALLSALTFHDTTKCYHSLGMGKPLGLGKVKLDVSIGDDFKNKEIKHYLKAFETAMNAELFQDDLKWTECEQIKNLFTMASEQDNEGSSALCYMQLDQFDQEKKSFLERYTGLDNIVPTLPKPLCSVEKLDEDIENYQASIVWFIEEKRKQNQEKQHKKSYEDAWNKIAASTNKVDFENFLSKHPEGVYTEDAMLVLRNLLTEEANLLEEQKKIEEEKQWKKVLESDEEYLKNMLIIFIQNYPDSEYIRDAKERLRLFKEKTASKKVEYTMEAFENADNLNDALNLLKQYFEKTLRYKYFFSDDIEKIKSVMCKFLLDISCTNTFKKKNLKKLKNLLNDDDYNDIINKCCKK